MKSGKRRIIVAIAFLLALFTAGLATATPILNEQNKGVLRWPDNTTIHVYIPADPSNLGRDTSLANGIKQWNSQPDLQNRGIKFDTTIGVPPPGATNAVTVSWVNSLPDGALGAAGATGTVTSNGQNVATGGAMEIVSDTTDVDTKMATNLGIHEGGHILGLADKPNAADWTAGEPAMNPNFNKGDSVTITAADKHELNAVYAANPAGAQATVNATVTQSGSLYTYNYGVSWLSGGNLGVYQVDTNGANILSVSAPTNWAINAFSPGTDVSLDLADVFPPESFISFSIADETTYLSPELTNLDFSFTTDRGPGTGSYFLNGIFSTEEAPSAVPEPSSVLLLFTALISVIGLRAREAHKC